MDAIAQELEQIAKKYLLVETLETRNSDDMDFYNVAVWNIKEALLEAYERGIDNAHKNDAQ
jgi:hypothetical protein